jgi:hypothetical protein
MKTPGIAIVISMLALAFAACAPGEGERCNPLAFNDECGTGLSCLYPANCGVAYCCPPADKVIAATPATCQVCVAQADAMTDTVADASTDTGADPATE